MAVGFQSELEEWTSHEYYDEHVHKIQLPFSNVRTVEHADKKNTNQFTRNWGRGEIVYSLTCQTCYSWIAWISSNRSTSSLSMSKKPFPCTLSTGWFQGTDSIVI